MLVGTSEFSWFYWLSISPGLRKIIARALEIKSTSDIDIVNEGEDDEEARIVDLRYQGKIITLPWRLWILHLEKRLVLSMIESKNISQYYTGYIFNGRSCIW